jgi:hypothetical protein
MTFTNTHKANIKITISLLKNIQEGAGQTYAEGEALTTPPQTLPSFLEFTFFLLKLIIHCRKLSREFSPTKKVSKRFINIANQ